MAQYKINDTTLTAIGDAIRNKTGEFTKIGLAPMDVPIVYDVIVPVGGRIENIITDSVIVNNAAKVKLVFTFNYGNSLAHITDNIGIYNDNTNLGTVRLSSGKNQEVEYPITGNTATIRFASNVPSTQYGVKIEVYYYDIDNNLITTHEGEVPNTMTPAQMADAIEAIEIVDVEELSITTNGIYTAPEGVGYSPIVVNVDGAPPAEALVITGNCNYRFANNGWNWFIDMYGNQITTKDISNCSYMFSTSGVLTSIPFDINISNNCKNIGYMFYNCNKLVQLPLIKGDLTPPTSDYGGVLEMGNMFSGCNYLREIPYDYFWNFGDEAFWEASKKYAGMSYRQYMFQYCFSLRELPDISMMITNSNSPYNMLYYSGFANCHALNEIVNLPVLNRQTMTSNMFNSTFNSCNRVKNITFAMNEDGTPQTANWKNQTIDLSAGIGYVYSSDSDILNYNSGITADKAVKSAADYERLKDDPDWFASSGMVSYSRYNHDSAVRTINSLPDTSAYLATAGGTNTIKFKTNSGKNSGGAISELTAEEIAVATAKGWTVTLA